MPSLTVINRPERLCGDHSGLLITDRLGLELVHELRTHDTSGAGQVHRGGCCTPCPAPPYSAPRGALVRSTRRTMLRLPRICARRPIAGRTCARIRQDSPFAL